MIATPIHASGWWRSAFEAWESHLIPLKAIEFMLAGIRSPFEVCPFSKLVE
jgi:hypothetical protein